MNQIAILADDLTGAADTGIQFLHAGMEADVLLSPEAVSLSRADVLVGVTDTRNDPQELAKAKTAAWARMLASLHPVEIYKKVDSTLRGSPFAELDACMSAFAGRMAVFAPAYPLLGRTTVNGVHLLHGRPLEESEVSRDPTAPVYESNIPRMLARETGRRIGHLRLGVLEDGPPAVTEELRNLLAAGAEVLISDAVTDQHLVNLVAGVHSLGLPVLWSGSAGLARQLLPAARRRELEEPWLPGPMLVIAGSVSQALRSQVEQYTATTGAACLTVDSQALAAADDSAHNEVNRSLAVVTTWLSEGKSAVITTSLEPRVLDQAGPRMVLTARTLSDQMGVITREILAAGFAGTIFLSGGDTALGVCRRLGARGIHLQAEILPGVVLGSLAGGPHAGRSVITKAGSFGEVDVLCQISRLIQPFSPE